MTPMRRMSGSAVHDLVTCAREDLAQVVDDACTAIRGQLEFYRHGDAVPVDDLKQSVALNLGALLDALVNPDATSHVGAAEETGRTRARQRAPLPEVLQAFRIANTTLWDGLAGRVRGAVDPRSLSALAEVANVLWHRADAQAQALTDSYRDATAELVAAHERRRAALVDALFSGHIVLNSGPWEIGKMLGLSLDGSLVVAVVETLGTPQDGRAAVEKRLAEHGIVSAWYVNTTLYAGVVSLREDQHGLMLRMLREAGVTRAGLSPVYRSLADTPRAFHLARTALAEIPAGDAAIREFSSSPLAGLVARDPDEGRRMAQDVLGAVLDLPAEDRQGLLETLRVYFDEGGSTERTARTLHCHPNTVRYRLHRITELTGRSLNEPRTLAELVTATYALGSHDDNGRRGGVGPRRSTG